MPSAEHHRKPAIPEGKQVANAKQEELAAAETGDYPRSMSVDEKPLTGNTVIDSRIRHHENSWDCIKESLIAIVDDAKGQKRLDFGKLSEQVSKSFSKGERNKLTLSEQ